MAERNPILDAAKNSQPTPTTVPTSIEETVVNPILKEAEQYAERTATRGKEQQQIISQQMDVAKLIQEASKKSAEAQQTIQTQKNIADLQTQNANIEVFDAAGGTEFLKTLAKEQKAAAERVVKLGNQVEKIRNTKRTGIGLIDVVINELASIQEQVQLETATNEFNNLNNTARDITAMAESAAQTHLRTQKSLNESTIAAAQEKLISDTQIEYNKTRLSILQTNADQVTAMMNADARVLDARHSAYVIRNEVEDRQLRLKQHQLAVEAAQRQATDWQEGRDIEDDTVKAVQRAQAVANQTVEPDNVIKAGLRSRSADVYKRYETLFVIGASNNEQIGNTPADSMLVMNTISTGGIPDSPEFNILQELNGELRESPLANNIKDEESYKAAVNTLAANKAESYSKEIATGDSKNWYAAPPMSILSENAAVKNSKLYKTVLEPMQFKETDPASIIAASIAGIQAGTVTVEDAVSGLTTIFKAAGDYNNATKKFKRVGLPEQTSYNVNVNDPNFGFTAKALATGIATALIPFEFFAPGPKEKKEFRESLKKFRSGNQRTDLQDESSVRETMVRLLSSAGFSNAYKNIGTEGE